MINLCKSNGLVIFSCATTGRKEHGTTKSEPQSSPLTVNLGWDYYQNLTEANFREVFDFENLFLEHIFMENAQSNDLYFYGLKK